MTDLPDLPPLTNTDWLEHAACRGMDPDLFHPSRTSPSHALVRTAKAVCDTCPVRDTCLQVALDDPTHLGIMGGTTADERRGIRAGHGPDWRAQRRAAHRALHPRPLAPISHGTESGYTLHRRRGEEPCDLCRDGHRDYKRAWEALRRAQEQAS